MKFFTRRERENWNYIILFLFYAIVYSILQYRVQRKCKRGKKFRGKKGGGKLGCRLWKIGKRKGKRFRKIAFVLGLFSILSLASFIKSMGFLHLWLLNLSIISHLFFFVLTTLNLKNIALIPKSKTSVQLETKNYFLLHVTVYLGAYLSSCNKNKIKLKKERRKKKSSRCDGKRLPRMRRREAWV